MCEIVIRIKNYRIKVYNIFNKILFEYGHDSIDNP